MNTEVLRVDPVVPDPAIIARAAELLRAGRLVAFPTETVYGLGANALDAAAVRSIFTAKGRPATNPVIVHVAEPTQVLNVAASWPETASCLATQFWPGPLTIVVPRKPGVPDEVTAGGPTIALRCPNHPVARELIRAAGVPVAAPSANRSTEISPTRAEHVFKSLNGRIDLLLDGGPCSGGIESTVVDVTGPVVRLLRPGLITVPMLEEFVGTVEVLTRTGADDGDVVRSPGQLARHYAPQTPVVLFDRGWPDLDDAVMFSILDGKRATTLEFGEARPRRPELLRDSLHCVFMPTSPDEYAANLYRMLHEADDRDADLILIEMPPDTPEWAAIRDRLSRAATRA